MREVPGERPDPGVQRLGQIDVLEPAGPSLPIEGSLTVAVVARPLPPVAEDLVAAIAAATLAFSSD